jgi:hypothetical protein
MPSRNLFNLERKILFFQFKESYILISLSSITFFHVRLNEAPVGVLNVHWNESVGRNSHTLLSLENKKQSSEEVTYQASSTKKKPW